jgi:methylthioribulose-1-phosphate dehydratase
MDSGKASADWLVQAMMRAGELFHRRGWVPATGGNFSARLSSYETGLHTQLYRHSPEVGAVLHVHTVANTVLSRRLDTVVLSGYELLKLLPGAPDPAASVAVPVFGNDQDIARLSARVDDHMRRVGPIPAYLIAGHGLYAWGETVDQARHRVEALEFMFECELMSWRLSQ